MTPPWEGVKYYCGFDAGTLQGRRFNLTGPRMFNWTYGPHSRFAPFEVVALDGMCDSGAFQHIKPGTRVTPAEALAGQLAWEDAASEKFGREYRHAAVVSYDRLVDEKWQDGRKVKERWDVTAGGDAVRDTVEGAAYLASQRRTVAPRKLVMGCQGVDAVQYAECAAGVLAHCEPGDVFGLGGWCILGKKKSLLPTFWGALHKVLPAVAAAGVKHVHVFGVMWLRPLGGLLWLADRLGLAVSTDSQKAASDCTWLDPRNGERAGVVKGTWEENVAWWRERLRTLRATPHYREPPAGKRHRQPDLFAGVD